MALVLQRISLALMLALGLSTVWVAASAMAAPANGLAAAAHAAQDDDGDDDDDGGDDDRDDGQPEGGVETGGGGTADQGGADAGMLVPASLAGLATVGGGLLLWRRQAAQR